MSIVPFLASLPPRQAITPFWETDRKWVLGSWLCTIYSEASVSRFFFFLGCCVRPDLNARTSARLSPVLEFSLLVYIRTAAVTRMVVDSNHGTSDGWMKLGNRREKREKSYTLWFTQQQSSARTYFISYVRTYNIILYYSVVRA